MGYVSDVQREEPMFDMEINAHHPRISPREKPTIANNTLESSNDKLLETRKHNEEMLNKIDNDQLTLLTKQVQKENGWGNSFMSDYEVCCIKP